MRASAGRWSRGRSVLGDGTPLFARPLCYRDAMRAEFRWILLASLVTVGGCGGGDGGTGSIGSGGSGSGGTIGGSWTAGVFPPASSFQNQCANPRTGTDPVTGRRYPDVQG